MLWYFGSIKKAWAHVNHAPSPSHEHELSRGITSIGENGLSSYPPAICD